MSENTENRQGATPDLSGMLGQLLQNPQAMGQVMQMADTLRRSGGLGTADSDRADGIVQSNDGASEGSLGGMSNFGGKGENDGNRSGGEKGGAHGVSESDRTHLLQALKPFLSDERQEKADTIIRIMGLLGAAGKMGLFPSPDRGNSR